MEVTSLIRYKIIENFETKKHAHLQGFNCSLSYLIAYSSYEKRTSNLIPLSQTS